MLRLVTYLPRVPTAPVFYFQRLHFSSLQKRRGPPRQPTKSSHLQKEPLAPRVKKEPAKFDAPLSNQGLIIAHRSLRVIDSSGANLGVIDSPAALASAKSKGLDLVLVNATSLPPVARIMSLGAELRKRRLAASAYKSTISAQKLKEIRLTARTDEHDLGIKVKKVEAFLQSGHPVKVTVTFSGNGFLGREESSRREIMASVARRVANGGLGWCDPSLVAASSINIQAVFTPTSSPKPQAAWEPLFELLSRPVESKVRPASSVPAPPSLSKKTGASPLFPPLPSVSQKAPVSATLINELASPNQPIDPLASALPSAKTLLKDFSDILPLAKPRKIKNERLEDIGRPLLEEEDALEGDDEIEESVSRGRRRSKRL